VWTDEAVKVLGGADRVCDPPSRLRHPIGDLCRQLGVSDATFYAWKKKYAHLAVSELRRLRQLEEENSRLKQLVADLSLDKHMLSEALRKKV
jgi:putative transposase